MMGREELSSILTKNQDIIDGLKPICQCKGIRKSVFLKHIKAGLRTVEELKKATGTGGGSCKGKRCTARIIELLKVSK
jgi:NAD(P)H-nitrite reductase large subunit